MSDSMIVMEYGWLQKGWKGHLVMYPFKQGELRSILEKAGFRDIKTYGDYKEDFDPDDVAFYTHVCRR